MFGAIYFGQTYFAGIGQTFIPTPVPLVGFITSPGLSRPTQNTGV